MAACYDGDMDGKRIADLTPDLQAFYRRDLEVKRKHGQRTLLSRVERHTGMSVAEMVQALAPAITETIAAAVRDAAKTIAAERAAKKQDATPNGFVPLNVVEIHCESAKAFQVTLPDGEQVWLPKAAIENAAQHKPGGAATIMVRAKLLQRNGLAP